MPALSHHSLSKVIAQRLARDPWDEATLRRRLDRHLPPTDLPVLRRIAAQLWQAFPRPVAPRVRLVAKALADMPEMTNLRSTCLQQDMWPTPYLTPAPMRPAPPFARLSLPNLSTCADLADWLMIPQADLNGYVDTRGWREDHDEMAVNHYFTRLIAKSGGGHRVIEAPKPRLKTLQRLLLRRILSAVPVHSDAYAFCAGRDCRAAAMRHTGEEVVIAFDLKDYFSGIAAPRVFGLFRRLGYPEQVADALVGLCTTVTPYRIRQRLPHHRRMILKGAHLPQGAPTSPALANLISYRLDTRLHGLAQRLGATYTRYADDLTFSGDRWTKTALLARVPEIIADEGFAVNAAKTRVMPAQSRQCVTGIVVNQAINIPRPAYDRLKAIIHARHWQTDPALHSQLMGQIGWVAQVNPAKGAKLRHLMASASTAG